MPVRLQQAELDASPHCLLVARCRQVGDKKRRQRVRRNRVGSRDEWDHISSTAGSQ